MESDEDLLPPDYLGLLLLSCPGLRDIFRRLISLWMVSRRQKQSCERWPREHSTRVSPLVFFTSLWAKVGLYSKAPFAVVNGSCCLQGDRRESFSFYRHPIDYSGSFPVFEFCPPTIMGPNVSGVLAPLGTRLLDAGGRVASGGDRRSGQPGHLQVSRTESGRAHRV